MWMVRAERGGVLFDDFMTNGHVTIAGTNDFGMTTSKADIQRLIAELEPNLEDRSVLHASSVVHRFAHQMKTGDQVVTYDPSSRVYAVGTVSGPYRHDAVREETIPGKPHGNIRPVRWEGEVMRDTLSPTAKSALGSIHTIYVVRAEAAEELRRSIRGDAPRTEQSAAPEPATSTDADEGDGIPSAAALEEQAMTGIADLVTSISPDDMEEFVAGLLRALGYHARVSPKGPDRGRDILATPDPLGLEDPRIHVEVKHRAGKASPGMIRSFLGGRGPGDRGIFVSTGGFTREARYEADRASIPVQLLDIEDLVRLLIENYAKLKPEIARMIPLRRIWWPH